MGKQIKGRCRMARENFHLSTGKFLKKNRPLPWRRIAYVEYPDHLDEHHLFPATLTLLAKDTTQAAGPLTA